MALNCCAKRSKRLHLFDLQTLHIRFFHVLLVHLSYLGWYSAVVVSCLEVSGSLWKSLGRVANPTKIVVCILCCFFETQTAVEVAIKSASCDNVPYGSEVEKKDMMFRRDKKEAARHVKPGIFCQQIVVWFCAPNHVNDFTASYGGRSI